MRRVALAKPAYLGDKGRRESHRRERIQGACKNALDLVCAKKPTDLQAQHTTSLGQRTAFAQPEGRANWIS